MSEQNGSVIELPAIALVWDEPSKEVQIHFDEKVFKNWIFVMGVIEMAKVRAEHMMRMQMIQGMAQQQTVAAQQAARAAQEAERIRQLNGG